MIEPPRMNLAEAIPDAVRHLMALEAMISKKLDFTLAHLLKVRASQINGCAFCIEMHMEAALKHGERPERIAALPAWTESPLYSDKERAALTWLDEVTLISTHHASREAYEGLKRHFSDEEIAWLTLLSAMINCWNRIAISSRVQYNVSTVETAKKLAEQL
jgi:AhpD family alkylhydroperoxidase